MILESPSSNILHRKRIFDILKKSMEYPLVIVNASAGFGKTIAVSSFLQQTSAKVIWYQLSLLDQNNVKFWDNFALKLTAISPEIPNKVRQLSFPDSVGRSNLFHQVIVEHMKPGIQYTIVFDDFHLIKNNELILFVDRLVNACISMLSIIIISRTYPPINTISLMSKGLVLQINEDDLRFNEDEMIAYFSNQGLIPSDRLMSKLYKQTRGWILAIYITSLSLKQKPVEEDYALSSMKLNIFKMIESEIYAPLSNEMKQLVVTLSLFENLPSELLKVLSGHNEKLIDSITNITSFIRLDIYENTYNFHHLFLDFLHEKQSILTEEQKKTAYIEAAKWYFCHDYKIDAIDCYKNAKEYRTMLLIMNDFPTIPSTEISTYFVNLIDSITDMKEEYYLGRIIHARYFHAFNSREDTTALYNQLAETLKNLPDSPEKSYYICAINIIIGIYNMVTIGRDFVEPLMIAYKTGLRGYAKAVYNIGNYAFPFPKSFSDYMKQVDSIIHYMTHVLHGCGYGYNYLCKGEYAFFQRNISVATKYLLIARANAKKYGQYCIEDFALFYLLRIKISQGNLDDVMKILEQLKQQTQIYKYLDYFTMSAFAFGWFYALIGQLEKSVVWKSKDIMKPQDMTSTNSSGLFQLILAKCYLENKQFIECLALLDSLDNEPVVQDYYLGKLEVATMKAVTLFHLKEKEEAINMLYTAYELSYNNDFIMPFVELGNHILGLIKTAVKYKNSGIELNISDEWLENIYRKASAYAKKISYLAREYKRQNNFETNAIQSLTKNEIECLQDLCKGLSRAEIAADKNISENYVKILIQNIYSKLEVYNVKEAIRIAAINKLI